MQIENKLSDNEKISIKIDSYVEIRNTRAMRLYDCENKIEWCAYKMSAIIKIQNSLLEMDDIPLIEIH